MFFLPEKPEETTLIRAQCATDPSARAIPQLKREIISCIKHCVLLLSCSVMSNSFVNPWLGSSVHGDSPGKHTHGVGCHFLLQGIFSTQESNPHLLLWQASSLALSHLGSQPAAWTRTKTGLLPKSPRALFVLESIHLLQHHSLQILTMLMINMMILSNQSGMVLGWWGEREEKVAKRRR